MTKIKIGSKQRLHAQCDKIVISIDDTMIKSVNHTKSLGLTIQAQLSWSKHVDEICKKASSAIGAFKGVRPFISKNIAVEIYNALICHILITAAQIFFLVNQKRAFQLLLELVR